MQTLLHHDPLHRLPVAEDEIMPDLRGIIKESGMQPKDLATAANISYGTVCRIIYGPTRWPRITTVRAIAKVFGYRLDLVKIKHSH